MKLTLLYMVSLAAAALMAMTAVNAQMKDFTIRTLSTKEFCEKVYDINADELKYKGDKPAIVDFYADWCGPCKMLSPIVDEVAEEFDNIKVSTLDNKLIKSNSKNIGINNFFIFIFQHSLYYKFIIFYNFCIDAIWPHRIVVQIFYQIL